VPDSRGKGIKHRRERADRKQVNTGVSSTAVTTSRSPFPSLICRVGDRMIAVALANVVETMRPLPITYFPGTPPFVLGVCTIRGAVVPVVDVGSLIGAADAHPGRFVTVAVAGRSLALAVEVVIGAQTLTGAQLEDLPPLFSTMDQEVFTAIGTLDAGLLLVLDTAHLLPEPVWRSLTDPVAPEGVRAS
jgi:purine-binding chemotaxis protein CheW